MSCVVCLADDAVYTIVPCGHVCLCRACGPHFPEEHAACPLCRGRVERTMRVFLTSQPQPQPLPLHPPEVQESGDDEALAVATNSRLVLAIEDVVDLKDQMFKEMERIERRMHSQPDLPRLALGEALRLLGVSVPQHVLLLRAQGRDVEYAETVLAEADRVWRRTAFLLHPDKAKAEPFWQMNDRLARLEAAFKFWGNLHDTVQARLSSFMTSRVNNANMFYYLDDYDDAFVMCVSLTWDAPSSDDLDVLVRFDDGVDRFDDGVEMELQVPFGTNSVTFAETSQPCMFRETFAGFRLTHANVYGKFQASSLHEAPDSSRGSY